MKILKSILTYIFLYFFDCVFLSLVFSRVCARFFAVCDHWTCSKIIVIEYVRKRVSWKYCIELKVKVTKNFHN